MTLTRKQRDVLEAVRFLVHKGENPTVRDVARLLGLSAPATVHKHLKALESAGYVEMSGKSRGIRPSRGVGIPVVGRIAAGEPLENPDGESVYDFPEVTIDPSVFHPGAAPGELVAVRVVGDSMIDAGIFDGDVVIIRRQPVVEPGEIAAVTVDGAGTLKRWHREAGGDRGSKSRAAVRLSPANERFSPLEIREDEHREVRVLGKYIGLIRGEHLQIR